VSRELATAPSSPVCRADDIVPLYDSYSKTKRANWMISEISKTVSAERTIYDTDTQEIRAGRTHN